MPAEAEIFDRLRKTEMQITSHEAVCAERYNAYLMASTEIKRDLNGLKKDIKTLLYAILGGLATLLAAHIAIK